MIQLLETIIPLCNIVGMSCLVSGYMVAGRDVDEAMHNYDEKIDTGTFNAPDLGVHLFFLSCALSVIYIGGKFLGY